MENRNRTTSGVSALIQGIIAGVAMIWLGAGTAWGAPPTPVTFCGQILATPGDYILTGSLNCVGTAVRITADNVRFFLNGFTLSGDGTTGSGIEVESVSRVRVRGGTVLRFGNGIRLAGATSVRINDMMLTANGDGVQLQSSDNNRISDSMITGNTIGVRLDGSDNNTVNANTVSNNVADPAIAASGGVLVQNGSTGNLIAANIMASNGSFGVSLQGSDSNGVEGNTVSDTTDGSPKPGISVVASSFTRALFFFL